MSEFEKIAAFASWCIEEYSVFYRMNPTTVANSFAQKGIISFLEKHYEVLHTQGKDYILGTLDDLMKKGD